VQVPFFASGAAIPAEIVGRIRSIAMMKIFIDKNIAEVTDKVNKQLGNGCQEGQI